MTTKENIKNLYETFKKYKLNGKIEKCHCGCISEEEEEKIYSKTLRILEADDIGFYSTKAISTWGNINDFKHFLPRIIEIYRTDKANGWIDLETIHNKLEEANWKDWNKSEQNIIEKIIEYDWRERTNQKESYIWKLDFEEYQKFFDIEYLLKLWEFPKNKMALKNFVEFFYMEGNEIISNEKKENFNNLIRRENLTKGLEEEFFKYEKADRNYAFKVSAVLKMIENEIQVKKENGR
jgi:hypothetical protein